MGRPRTKQVKEGEMVNVAFKLDGSIVKRLDAEAEHLTDERPGLAITRTDIVRMAIHEWLAAHTKPRGK